MVGHEDLHRPSLREEPHLVDHGDDGLQDLALEGAEDDALVLDREGDVARALPDEPLADILHPRDRHHEPVPPAAGALDVLDELGDELVAEVRAEVPRVQLHVPLQHDVEEHLAPSSSAPPASERAIPQQFDSTGLAWLLSRERQYY